MTIHTLDLATAISELHRVRQQRPLVHCLTNEVVQNFTANVLLALDISPAMVVAKEEVVEFVALSSALLINLGTVYAQRVEAMHLAASAAMQSNTPWVLDPVAVGVLKYRSDFALQLCELKPSAIRGNASEILALAGRPSHAQGVDSHDCSMDALAAAKTLARRYQTIVAVTGATDYITDGQQTLAVNWGTPQLTKVTGTGCALSAVVAAFLSGSNSPLSAVASACATIALAGQIAAKHGPGCGRFQSEFLDALSLAPAHFSEVD